MLVALVVTGAAALAIGAGSGGLRASAPEETLSAPDAPSRDAPKTVVSLNLCTDQLAMMLAAPGQLAAVTALAANPRTSAMAEKAADLPVIHGRAEEVYLMAPDLVLAGRFTDRATVDMLRRLGLRVEEFNPAYALSDIPDRLARMGDLLGRPDRAEALIDRFNADLAALRHDNKGPRAALYYANGYTSGDTSLAGQILRAAGFENIATEMGFGAIGALPLEMLAMAAPDVVVTGNPYPGASRAEAVMEHPVVTALKRGRVNGTVTDRDWVCGTPHALRAVTAMADLRRRVEAAR
ncbi:ABC transporter substrate-binding protein [Lutimaribacter sp. EGI FJ00014]|uniref:ABC transporter substrate-binding protein n=1 Tax=Lutimaribacter degradans TaxID=2945989 RepID=A0ACC5ZXC8_9RHOB|nr:ABC transporter substrate-binding protein [Lutimaribacter sp. EGI FJ00013]MCM2562987.1 ABC transporter substrate-binding protein [Lutimaribacter sp. EGI FJ00013]MCO0636132.1 ABC transporter substrate-binding protein [Lutimaribacter sp. EGI FJ00014]